MNSMKSSTVNKIYIEKLNGKYVLKVSYNSKIFQTSSLLHKSFTIPLVTDVFSAGSN